MIISATNCHVIYEKKRLITGDIVTGARDVFSKRRFWLEEEDQRVFSVSSSFSSVVCQKLSIFAKVLGGDLACSPNIWKKCVKEKRLRVSEKIAVVVLPANLVYPMRGLKLTQKRI